MIKKSLKTAALLLVLLCVLSVFAFAAEQRVFDNSNLLSENEIQLLEAKIISFKETYNVDFIVLTSNDVEYYEGDDLYLSEQFAEDFYYNSNFSDGECEDAIVFFLDMNNRVLFIKTFESMVEMFNEERIDSLVNTGREYLANQDYYNTVSEIIIETGSFIDTGVPEDYYEYYNNGYYDDEYYDFYNGYNNAGYVIDRHLTRMDIFVAMLLGILAAVISAILISRKYNLKGETYKYDYRSNSTVHITGRQDLYVRTTHSRIAKPQHNDNSHHTHGGHSGGGHSGGGHSGGGHSGGGHSGGGHSGGGGGRF